MGIENLQKGISYTIDMKGGLLGNRLEHCKNIMVPHMWEILQDRKLCHSWENFLIASGQAEGEHKGPPFHDGDFYKWLESAIRTYSSEPESPWFKQIESIIGVIASIQHESGYIFTLDAISRKNHGKGPEMQNELNFEVYNMGHLITAACVHFNCTGRTNFLALAEKAAEYLQMKFRDSKDIRTAICPSHYMGLAQLYETTGKKQYLLLLKKLIELRDEIENGTDDNQDRVPLNEQLEIVGHAVRANYLYAGLTDIYRHSEEDEYRDILQSVWNDLVSKKIYITGGCGALYDGVSPYGHDDYFYIQRTHQAYGRAYELPNTAGYNETCAAIGHYMWNYRMALAFGEGKYGDYMEQGLYNTILSGINLKGDRYFYTNALRCLNDLPYSLKWSRHREPYIESFCCPPNVLRTIAAIPEYMCFEKQNGLAFLLYSDAQVFMEHENGSKCVLNMNTNYPFHGNINVDIESNDIKKPLSLYFRIPGWSKQFSVSINGKQSDEYKAKNGFIEINRIWNSGDSLNLSLDMGVRIMESNPMVEETRNHVAIVRGPVVYCLESVDLPARSDILNMYFKTDAVISESTIELEGVEMTALHTDLWSRNEKKWNGEELYRAVADTEYAKMNIQLIPYFAWDNREQGEMTVWLPLMPEH